MVYVIYSFSLDVLNSKKIQNCKFYKGKARKD